MIPKNILMSDFLKTILLLYSFNKLRNFFRDGTSVSSTYKAFSAIAVLRLSYSSNKDKVVCVDSLRLNACGRSLQLIRLIATETGYSVDAP